MNEKQKRFAKEYMIDLNATQAAIRAGYSPHTANEQGARLLAKDSVKEFVQQEIDRRAKRVEVSADRVLKELAIMANLDPAEIALAKIKKPEDIANLPENVRRAIVGWSWDKRGRLVLKLADKAQALQLIGRHLKLFTDKTEHSGTVTLEDLLATK